MKYIRPSHLALAMLAGTFLVDPAVVDPANACCMGGSPPSVSVKPPTPPSVRPPSINIPNVNVGGGGINANIREGIKPSRGGGDGGYVSSGGKSGGGGRSSGGGVDPLESIEIDDVLPNDGSKAGGGSYATHDTNGLHDCSCDDPVRKAMAERMLKHLEDEAEKLQTAEANAKKELARLAAAIAAELNDPAFKVVQLPATIGKASYVQPVTGAGELQTSYNAAAKQFNGAATELRANKDAQSSLRTELYPK